MDIITGRLGDYLDKIQFGTRVICVNANTDKTLFAMNWGKNDKTYLNYLYWWLITITAKDNALIFSITEEKDEYYRQYKCRFGTNGISIDFDDISVGRKQNG